jgi:c-di-GMP-binding flagellar brake protein YcgR
MFFRRKKKTGGESEEKGAEQRQTYRRSPGKNHALGVVMDSGGAYPFTGELIDLSAGGAGVHFGNERDPRLLEGDTAVLKFSSLVHAGEVRVDVKVVRAQGDDEEGYHYGFEFISSEQLFEQLDSFYFNYFNRRRNQRVRPALDRKFPMKVYWEGGNTDALANDLSIAGMSFVLSPIKAERVPVVEYFVLEFKVPKTSTVIETLARVRHRTKLEDGLLTGVELVPEDRELFEQSLPILDD